MSRDTARAEPVEEVRLTPCVLNCPSCPSCGQPMSVAYTKKRKLMTRRGLVRLHLSFRRCEQADCAFFHHPYHPEDEGHWALPAQELGLDVVLRVGQLRYREHRSCTEIHAQLEQEGVSLALCTTQNLLAQYELFVKSGVGNPA